MNVAIAVPVLADGDAVGCDALGMAAVLRADGHAVRFFAEKSLVPEETLPLERLMTTTDDVLIVHHSHGCAAAVAAVVAFPGRAIVKYHNVTPPRFFPAGSEVRTAAAAGRQQIHRLTASAAEVWCDSEFNSVGLDRPCQVIPPFMQSETLAAAAVDADTAAALDAAVTTVLMVGRVAPNKNVLLGLEAFAAYRRHDPTARLVIAGGHVFEEYSHAVTTRIDELGLTHGVIITGRVTVPQLKTLYLAADALLVTSEHEGFCVPIVEAMRLGTPVVAVNTTAIPGTAGDAARLVLPTAAAIASAMDAVVSDPREREHLVRAGRARFDSHFHPHRIASRFRELFSQMAATPSDI
jgi:glycosyltransferase involved in cell wall biosynthesis